MSRPGRCAEGPAELKPLTETKTSRGGRPQVVRPEAEPGQRSGPEVLHDDVRSGDQPQGRVPVALLLEVEDHRALPAVEGEDDALAVGADAARLVPVRWLDLDDLGAEIAEQLGRRGRRDVVTELDDSDSREWCGHAVPTLR